MPTAISFQMDDGPASGSKPDHGYGNEGDSDTGVGTTGPITSIDNPW